MKAEEWNALGPWSGLADWDGSRREHFEFLPDGDKHLSAPEGPKASKRTGIHSELTLEE